MCVRAHACTFQIYDGLLEARVNTDCVLVQIEAVLMKILMELKLLYKKHAPQLKPRTVPAPKPPSAECIDPVEDMYNIIEGSAPGRCAA